MLLALAACSNGGGGPGPATPVELGGTVNVRGSEDVSAGGGELEIAIDLSDFAFDPTFVKVAPGASLRVRVANDGAARHTFTIDPLDVDRVLSPGERRTVRITLPPLDEVVLYYCRFHLGSGMKGAFYVREGASP